MPQPRSSLRKKISRRTETVLITGGARGLGLAIATEYAKRGAELVLCSRTKADLASAKLQLQKLTKKKIHTIVCDVSRRDEVDRMIEEIRREFGRLDAVVNDAGVIAASPLENITMEDFETALGSNLWGMIHVSFAALPLLACAPKGRILNITSVGGVVPVPHLLPYTTSKFAAFGFSMGLGSSLRKHGVSVTTGVPFLMRTGSYLHADFKGDRKNEYRWFAKLSTLPLLTVSAGKAARSLVAACESRSTFVTVGWPVRIAQIAFTLFPASVSRMMGLVERILPTLDTGESKTGETYRPLPQKSYLGEEVAETYGIQPQTWLGARAAARWNESR